MKEFTRTPGGRFAKGGPFSGEEFRRKFLIPSLEEFDLVIIQMDGAIGYPPSFLDEAFGVLVEEVGAEKVQRKLRFEISNDPLTSARLQRIFSKHG